MWPFKRKQQVVPAPKQTEVEQAAGFFSTHNPVRVPDLGEWIQAHAFRKTHKDMVCVDSAGKAVAMDGMQADIKSAFGLGNYGALSQNLLAWYVSQGFIGYQACALLAQNWLIDKACSVAPQDAVRKGYELTLNDGSTLSPEMIQYVNRIDRKFSLKKNLVQFAKLNRVFGIRIALFEVESTDPDYYTKPFNIDGITPYSYKGISQVDPMWITPELDQDAAGNTASKYFYEPTFWRINGKRYHRTHLIVIRYSEVPDVLKPSYVYGGLPLTQLMAERVYSAERTANEAPLLALTKRTTVLHTDMDKVMMDQETFEEKLATWIYYRDNQGVKVVGEDEEVEQIDTSLTDLDEVIMTQYQIVAAIAKTPATKLLGTSPKGFGASGEYEESSYHEYLETIQSDEMTPMLDRHYALLVRSHIVPAFGEEFSKLAFDIVWKPLDSMTESELAEVRLKNAQSDVALQSTGAIDGLDIRKRLALDKHSGYNGMELPPELDEGIDDQV